MHTPKSSTLHELELNDHMGPDSLDMIIRRKYDRRAYEGQQTGEMLPNDSYHLWDFSTEDDVEERVLNTYGRDESGSFVSMDLIQNWLDAPEPVYPLRTPVYWGEAYQYYLNYVRDLSPEPDLLLADLIRRGEMPYGRYLIHCWW